MVFYTNFLIPKGIAGITLGFIILLRPKYRDDIGRLEHEKTHVKQFWSSFGLFPFIYLLNAKYRYKCELVAYKVQLIHSFDKISDARLFALFLSTKYWLNITEEKAYFDLTEK